MKGKKLYLGLLVGVLGIGFLGYMSAVVVPKVFVTWTKAAPATKVSLSDSYMLGGNILAKADGVDTCVVNVFVLDSNGKGVKGMATSVVGMPEGEMQMMSDSDGKAVFKISSVNEGQFILTASVGGAPLARTMKITFRN